MSSVERQAEFQRKIDELITEVVKLKKDLLALKGIPEEMEDQIKKLRIEEPMRAEEFKRRSQEHDKVVLERQKILLQQHNLSREIYELSRKIGELIPCTHQGIIFAANNEDYIFKCWHNTATDAPDYSLERWFPPAVNESLNSEHQA